MKTCCPLQNASSALLLPVLFFVLLLTPKCHPVLKSSSSWDRSSSFLFSSSSSTFGAFNGSRFRHNSTTTVADWRRNAKTDWKHLLLEVCSDGWTGFQNWNFSHPAAVQGENNFWRFICWLGPAGRCHTPHFIWDITSMNPWPFTLCAHTHTLLTAPYTLATFYTTDRFLSERQSLFFFFLIYFEWQTYFS